MKNKLKEEDYKKDIMNQIQKLTLTPEQRILDDARYQLDLISLGNRELKCSEREIVRYVVGLLTALEIMYDRNLKNERL